MEALPAPGAGAALAAPAPGRLGRGLRPLHPHDVLPLPLRDEIQALRNIVRGLKPAHDVAARGGARA